MSTKPPCRTHETGTIVCIRPYIAWRFGRAMQIQSGPNSPHPGDLSRTRAARDLRAFLRWWVEVERAAKRRRFLPRRRRWRKSLAGARSRPSRRHRNVL